MAGQFAASLPHLGLLGAAYVLTAESGTYSVTGQDAGLLFGVPWGPAPLPHIGSVLPAGSAQYTLTAEFGSYDTTGQDVSSSRTYVVAANFGEYLFAGQAGILHAPGANVENPAPLPHLGLLLGPDTTAYTLVADPGFYVIVGSDALADFEVAAEQGTYTVTGQDAGLLKTTILTAESGTYSVTGQDAEFSIGGTDRVMAADFGTYSISGQDAGLLPAYRLAPEHGFYALLGQAASLVYAPPVIYTLTAESGTYSHTGQDANLDARRLYAEYGTYEITGYTVTDLPRSTAAGKSSQSKKPRKKLSVEIDGEVFAVGSREEAAALLAQAKEAAEEQARLAVERAVKAERRPTRRVLADARKSLKPPEIVASEEFVAEAEALTKEIEAIYQDAMVKVEIAALMRREEEDEEEALLLLL
jgi:hypothetical protein